VGAWIRQQPALPAHVGTFSLGARKQAHNKLASAFLKLRHDLNPPQMGVMDTPLLP